MEPAWQKRLRAQEERRNEPHTHYLWRDAGESLDDVRERFRRMVELGPRCERRLHHLSLGVVIATLGHESLHPTGFPCYFLFLPVPDPGISADVLAGTHFFAGFGCRPPPFTGICRQGSVVCASRQIFTADVADGSKRELPSGGPMSASAGCGHAVARGYLRELPIAVSSRRSTRRRVTEASVNKLKGVDARPARAMTLEEWTKAVTASPRYRPAARPCSNGRSPISRSPAARRSMDYPWAACRP